MSDPNAYQVADWNGPNGERWVANQIRLDAMLDVFGQAAITAAAPIAGEQVLDIGCGAEENDWVRLPMGAIKEIGPPAPPPDPEAPGPFSFGDRDRVNRILSDACFSDVVIEAFDHVIPFGAGETREAALDDAVAMAFEVGPLSRTLVDQPEDTRSHTPAWHHLLKRRWTVFHRP